MLTFSLLFICGYVSWASTYRNKSYLFRAPPGYRWWWSLSVSGRRRCSCQLDRFLWASEALSNPSYSFHNTSILPQFQKAQLQVIHIHSTWQEKEEVKQEEILWHNLSFTDWQVISFHKHHQKKAVGFTLPSSKSNVRSKHLVTGNNFSVLLLHFFFVSWI